MEAKWEELSSCFSNIREIMNKLIRTPDDKAQLKTLQQQLEELWATYQRIGIEARELAKEDKDDSEAVEKAVTRALKAYNITSQGITNKLEKLAQTGITRSEEPQPVVHESPIRVQVSPPEAADQPDVHALYALLTQVTDQFNEIIGGKYPKPGPQEPDPILQTLPSPEQQIANTYWHRDDNDSTHEHAKDANTAHTGSPGEPIPAHPIPRPAPAKTTAQTTVPADALQQPRIELKMDKFTLPIFDGDLTKWPTFKDQFVDMVHTNPNYSSITKFIHLTGHLKGSALEAIQGFKLSAANYEAAWYVLLRRYDKPDQIVDEYLRKLIELPAINTPTAQRLIAMVNCANQIIRVFPSLGVNVSNWDAIIKFNLTSKLDRATHKKWLDQVKLRQNVPLEELIDFLEIEAGENLPMPGKSQRTYDPKRYQKPRYQPPAILTTVANHEATHQGSPQAVNRCPQCRGNHVLFLCPIFKKLKVKDRIIKVRGFKHCFRCLLKHNQPSDCKFGMCPVCTKDHNSLLCYTREKGANQTGARVSTVHAREA